MLDRYTRVTMRIGTVQSLWSLPKGHLEFSLSSKLACRYLDGISLSEYIKWRGRQNCYHAAEARMVAAATALIQVRIGDVFSKLDFPESFSTLAEAAFGQVRAEGAPGDTG